VEEERRARSNSETGGRREEPQGAEKAISAQNHHIYAQNGVERQEPTVLTPLPPSVPGRLNPPFLLETVRNGRSSGQKGQDQQ